MGDSRSSEPYETKDNNKAFGLGVRVTLEKLDKDVYWLCHETGIGVTVLKRVTAGKSGISLETALAICGALKMSVENVVRIGRI
jgi:DNA-binding Xre family transcriptional regulator